MKTATFTVRICDNEFIFDSEQDDLKTIKDIYEKRIKPKYPNFDFDVYVEDYEDYDEENECYGGAFYHIQDGEIRQI